MRRFLWSTGRGLPLEIWLMYGTVFIQLLSIGMVPALLNEMRVDLNASIWQLGWITGAYRPQIATVAFVLIAAFALSFTWSGVRGFLLPLYATNELWLTTESWRAILSGAGLFSLPILIVVGWLAKLHGPRQVLVAGLCLIALSTISVLVTKNVPGFVMSFIGISVGFCVWGMPVGILSNLTDRATTPALFAVLKFVADSAYFLGTIVLTSLLTAYGFRMALLSASSLAVAAAALIGGDLLVSYRKSSVRPCQ